MKYRSYRSIAQLNRDVVDWAAGLPRGFDVVVGIPRSGLLVANLLALHLDLPMTDPAGLLAGRVLRTPRAGGRAGDAALLQRRCNVLVVDDSVCSGGQLGELRARLRRARLPHRIRYGAVYITPEAHRRADVDYHAEIIPLPRSFEWNILHTPGLRRTCISLEGVVYETGAADGAGGDAGADPLEGVRPFYLPTHEVGWLLSCRPAEQRPALEGWLHRHGIRYRELITLPPGAGAAEKAAVYERTGAMKFFEGHADAAAEVARLAGRPVFCMQTREMSYPPGSAAPNGAGRDHDRRVALRALEQAGRTTRAWLRRLRDRAPIGN